MYESDSDLRRKRSEYQAQIKESRRLIAAAELLIQDVDRRLRERSDTARNLELREKELSGRRW
jgi:hypothetical protein